MKSTGIIRNIDPLGRIVVPMELRRTLGIQEKDPMEIFVDGESIILKNIMLTVLAKLQAKFLTKISN